jgi:hypothetical protein
MHAGKSYDNIFIGVTRSLGTRKVRWRRVFIWLGVLLAGLAILGYSAKPAYRVYRNYRIGQNLEAAKAAERLEDWSTARDKARSVLLARQQDFAAYRIWARSLSKLGEANASMAAAGLFSHPQATREDRLEMLQMLAAQAPQALAMRAFASLPDELRQQAAFRAAITPLLVLRGEVAYAEKRLREVLQPTDGPTIRLELLRTLCRRPDIWRMAEARRIFADMIAAKADTEALAALLLLGNVPNALAPGLALPDLPTWLKGQPKATTIHHLVAMQPTLESQPESAERLYASAVKRFLATDPGVLGTWLLSRDQATMAAEILKAPAQTRSDAYLAYLQASLRLRQESAVQAALIAPPASVDLVDIEIAHALLAVLRSKSNATEAAFTRAMNQAAFDTKRNRFLEIAMVAQRNGVKASAIDAWVAAVRLGWGQLPLYQDLSPVMGVLASEGRSEDLLAMCRALLRFEPFNTDLLNNFYYLALIHGILQPDKVAAAMTQLVAKNPARIGLNSTLMLAEILDGRPADALTRLPQLRVCKDVDPMMKNTLEGSARVLTGETDAGTALLRDVDWTHLMRQERIVFRDMLVKLKIAAIPVPEIKSEPVATDPDQVPAWRKAVEQLEKNRSADVLPALQVPKGGDNPDASPAWRKALEQREKDQASDILPALPAPRIRGTDLPDPTPNKP